MEINFHFKTEFMQRLKCHLAKASQGEGGMERKFNFLQEYLQKTHCTSAKLKSQPRPKFSTNLFIYVSLILPNFVLTFRQKLRHFMALKGHTVATQWESLECRICTASKYSQQKKLFVVS